MGISEPMGWKPNRFVEFSGRFSIVTLGIILDFFLAITLFPVLKTAQTAYSLDVVLALLIWLSLAVLIVGWVSTWKTSWLGQIFLALGQVGLFFPLNGLILTESQSFSAFPILIVFGWGIVTCMGLSLLMNLVNFLFIIPISARKRGAGFVKYLKNEYKFNNQQRGLKPFVIMMLIAGTGLIAGFNTQLWTRPITIQPQDYDASFAFWASIRPSTYTEEVKGELDQHQAMIITYDTYFNLDDPVGRQNFIDIMNEWKTNYPGVKVMPAIPCPISTFVWDGESAGVIESAKKYIELAAEENLTNLVGLSFDWEKPTREDDLVTAGISLDVNKSRHIESVALWDAFFDWRDENYPDFLLQNVNYVPSFVDAADGDFDINIRDQYVTLEVPRWDEYAPMIYRGSCDGTPPYGDYPYYTAKDTPKGHFWTYTQMKLLSDAVVAAHGNHNRLGVYLGITNCTCYGRDVVQYQNGVEAGYGYDALVRDALIAKHFGTPIITIFILNTVPDSSDDDFHYMGGVFDTWGTSFLDDFNASVNGVNSRNSFQIWYSGELDGNLFVPEYFEGFILDFAYNFQSIFGVVAIGGIIVLNILIDRKIAQKKRKGKNGNRALAEPDI